jgi:SAM-dependent methyltransferase
MRLAKRLLPGWIKKQLRERLRAETRSALNANGILASLYTPPSYTRHGTWLTWNRQSIRRSAGGLPIPPLQLRMGHASDDQQYLLAGASSAKFIREILEREGVSLTSGKSILEWGCAGGRVLRHFVREAERCDFWGVDQHGPSMSWCKENLSPPFKFLTCTAFPYLPFKDGEFTLVYAESVFTHILHLMDMWLMEFRRILEPGGYALFTVHDESTWQFLSENESHRRLVDAAGIEKFSGRLEHEIGFLKDGGNWDQVVSFLRTDWITREWGQYLDVVSFEPRSPSYQTTVVLRKS